MSTACYMGSPGDSASVVLRRPVGLGSVRTGPVGWTRGRSALLSSGSLPGDRSPDGAEALARRYLQPTFTAGLRRTYRLVLAESSPQVTEDAQCRFRLRAGQGARSSGAVPPMPVLSMLWRGEVGPAGIGVATVISVSRVCRA